MTMPWRVDPAGTLSAALALFPKTKRVVVVTGAKDGVLPFLDDAEKAFAPWTDRLTFEYTNAMTYEQMLRRITTLPPDSIIIYAPFFVDSAGRAFVPAEVALTVGRSANAPVFGFLDAFLGHGVIGGSVLRTDMIGRQVGRIALDYLSGRLGPQTRFDTPSQLMFDWPEFERWKLDPAHLPPGAILVNRPVTLWSQYRDTVVAAAAAFAIMALLILVLLITNRRLKRAEAAVSERESRFRTLVNNIPQKVFLKDTKSRYVTCNRAYADDLGIAECDIAGRSDLEFFPQDLAEKYRADDASVMSSRTARDMEETYVLDGQELTVETVKVPITDDRGAVIGVLGIFWEITERKLAEQALREKTDLLTHSNADLEQFAYVASHDLQTPLRNIVHFSQLLERRYAGRFDADADDFIKFIVASAKQMTHLIDDLLEYSRVPSQSRTLNPTPAGEALAQAMNNLSLDLARTGREVSVGDLPVVLAEPTHLTSLFQNLLENSLKYRAPGRPLKLSVTAERQEPDSWRFAVADNGIGIDPLYHDKIFEIFQRLDPGTEVEGTGIGLTLCRRIVHRFGGSIWLESTPGAGTTFFFTVKDGSAVA